MRCHWLLMMAELQMYKEGFFFLHHQFDWMCVQEVTQDI